jgi:peptide deformylase
MVLPIAAYGHPVLKKEAEIIDKDYPKLKKIIEDMYETMYYSVGVGLAAPQVNLSIGLFVVDGDPYKEEYPETENFKQVFINPKIIEEEGDDWEFKESCLSVPGIAEYVSRPQTIRVQYFDENFNFCDEKYSGMVSRIIQHEYDHLLGTVFVEKIHNLRKTLIKRKLLDISKGNVTASYKMIFGNKKKKK